eukprot:s398_g9.t1
MAESIGILLRGHRDECCCTDTSEFGEPRLVILSGLRSRECDAALEKVAQARPLSRFSRTCHMQHRNSTAGTMRAPNTPICARCWSPWAVQKVLGLATDAKYSPDAQAIVRMLHERWAQLGQTIQVRSKTARQRLVGTRPGLPASTEIPVYQHSFLQVRREPALTGRDSAAGASEASRAFATSCRELRKDETEEDKEVHHRCQPSEGLHRSLSSRRARVG